jgi:hypothetical protein
MINKAKIYEDKLCIFKLNYFFVFKKVLKSEKDPNNTLKTIKLIIILVLRKNWN